MHSRNYNLESGYLFNISEIVTSEISLLNYSEEDQDFVFDLFRKVKIDEFDAWNWLAPLLDNIIAVQFNAFYHCHKNNFPHVNNFIIQFNNNYYSIPNVETPDCNRTSLQHVIQKIFEIPGKEVATLVDEFKFSIRPKWKKRPKGHYQLINGRKKFGKASIK